MKSQSPFPSMAAILAEGRARQARAASCCDGPRNHDVPDAILKARTLPKLSAPRKGGSPPPVERPRLWEELARNPRKMGEMRKEGPPRPLGELRRPEGEDCACEVQPEAGSRATKGRRERTHEVSGQWLSSILRLGGKESEAFQQTTLRLDDETWGAIRSVQNARSEWRSTRREVQAKRAAIWPDGRMRINEQHQRDEPQWSNIAGGASSPLSRARRTAEAPPAPVCGDPCACNLTIRVEDGPRFVDSVLGDDANPGTFEASGPYAVIRPWKTLRRVERWLQDLADVAEAAGGACIAGAEVYLRRGRTWSGVEEKAADGSLIEGGLDWADIPKSPTLGDRTVVFTVHNFKATAEMPLILSSYSAWTELARESAAGGTEVLALFWALEGEATGSYPRVDGQTALSPSGSVEPQVRDSRVGILFYDCCHVHMSRISVRGFGTGVGIAGASKDHTYTRLGLYDNAYGGIGFGVNERDPSGPDLAAAIYEIAYETLAYPEDIRVLRCACWANGYDSAGQDIGIGFLATNCTVVGNVLLGGDARGVDGIVSQGASSGHLICDNRIGHHDMWCDSGPESAKFIDLGLDEPVLAESCGSLGYSGCEETPYGYVHCHFDGSDLSSFVEVEEIPAFAENGIDLKAVRVRTCTSAESTEVCGNTIYGHTIFCGIAIDDGSQDIHVYRNRVFQNNAGIVVANSPNDAWYNAADPLYYEIKTSNIYVYRNLVYFNRGYGVYVESGAGYARQSADPTMLRVWGVEGVYLIGNTIMHNLLNGVRIANQYADGDVDAVYAFNNLIGRNGYLGSLNTAMQLTWAGTFDLEYGRFHTNHNLYLGWGASPLVYGVGSLLMSVRRTCASTSFEDSLLQVDDLELLHLQDESTLQEMESSVPDPLPGDEGEALADNVRYLSASVVESLSYDLTEGSACIDEGTLSTRGFYALPVELAAAADFEGRLVYGDGVDVGAFEVWPEIIERLF